MQTTHITVHLPSPLLTFAHLNNRIRCPYVTWRLELTHNNIYIYVVQKFVLGRLSIMREDAGGNGVFEKAKEALHAGRGCDLQKVCRRRKNRKYSNEKRKEMEEPSNSMSDKEMEIIIINNKLISQSIFPSPLLTFAHLDNRIRSPVQAFLLLVPKLRVLWRLPAYCTDSRGRVNIRRALS